MHGRPEQRLGGIVERGMLAQLHGTHVGVGQQRRAGEARRLDRSRAGNPLLNGRRELARTAMRELLVGMHGTSRWMSMRSSSGPLIRF